MTKESTPESPALTFIDTHVHLDDQSFADDLDSVLRESRDAGVLAWIMVGFEPGRWEPAIRMSHEYPGMAHMLGVHPGSAQHWNDAVRDQLVQLLQSTGPRALGEIGFDFYRDNAPFDVQRTALVEQLDIACQLDLPVVFHIRDAESELLDVLRDQPRLPRMVFHSFDGTDALRRFVLEHDAVIGVGGLATRQKSHALREQLRQTPLSSMILETDSPYLVPARQKARRNTPAHVRTVALFLADLLGVDVAEVSRSTSATAERVFGKLLP